MSVSVERKGNEATLKFTIPVEEVAKGFERAVARVNKQVTIPGFRKGKAPRRVLEAHVGKDAIKEEAFQILANDNYRKALDDNNFIPVADPELKDSTLEEGKEMEMTLLVTLRPEVELGEYKNLDVKKVVREVTDKDVDDAISNLQNWLMLRKTGNWKRETLLRLTLPAPSTVNRLKAAKARAILWKSVPAALSLALKIKWSA